MNTGTILWIFTGLTIAIAILGLLGLAAYITEQRNKEIGIRKVLGATTREIIGKLSYEFILLICLSNALAWAPAYIFARHWLDGFEFRTSISVWVFVISAAISLFIAAATVGIKAWKSATSSPIKALKAES